MIEWQWVAFSELTADALYQVLRLRQNVFIVEQDCIYEDIDGADKHAKHLLGWQTGISGKHVLSAYLRVFEPGFKYEEASIGRVVIDAENRATGLGKKILAKAISLIHEDFPSTPIKISAQLHLEKFYVAYGFERVSAPYDEDEIMHVDMLKAC